MSQSRQTTPTPIKKTRKRIKYVKVPAQLHAELSEYATLLRTMRMSGVSDLTSELIRAGKCGNVSNGEDDDEEQTIASRVRKRPRLSVGLPDVGAAASSPSPSQRSTRKKGRQNDSYTRWPLLLEHCPTPEFEFEEEITAIAEKWLRDQNRLLDLQDTTVTNTSQEGKPRQTGDELATFFTLQTPSLFHSASSFLNTLLSSLAHHRHRRCQVEKRKTAPMTWVDVMEIVALMGDHGLDYDALERIESRLTEIYDSEESIALKSFQILSKSKETLREMDKKFQATLFEKLSIPRRLRKKILANERAKKDSKQEEREESEEEQESESSDSERISEEAESQRSTSDEEDGD